MHAVFEVGPFVFHWYGLIIGLGVLVGWQLAERAMRLWQSDQRKAPNHLNAHFWWILIGAFVGARAYHVIDYFDYYLSNPSELWHVWRGGLGIYGAILGGALGLYVSCLYRWRGRATGFRNFWWGLDALALGLPAAQAIGRLGNWVNWEVYGKPTALPWKIFIPPHQRMPGYESMAFYHPLFGYEALWNLAGLGVLWRLARLQKITPGKGNYFGLYIGWYALGRLWTEPLRMTYWNWHGIPIASMVGVVIIGGVWWFYLVRKRQNDW